MMVANARYPAAGWTGVCVTLPSVTPSNRSCTTRPVRVMAGSDCGFGTFAGFGAVDPEIAWAKLATLKEGARRAG